MTGVPACESASAAFSASEGVPRYVVEWQPFYLTRCIPHRPVRHAGWIGREDTGSDGGYLRRNVMAGVFRNVAQYVHRRRPVAGGKPDPGQPEGRAHIRSVSRPDNVEIPCRGAKIAGRFGGKPER